MLAHVQDCDIIRRNWEFCRVLRWMLLLGQVLRALQRADASQAAAVAAQKQLLLGWQLKANNSHDWISGNIFVIVGSGCLTEPSMSAINSEKNALLRSKTYCIWNLFKNSNFAFINTLWTAVFCYLSSMEDCLLIGHFLPFILYSDCGKKGIKKRQHHSSGNPFLWVVLQHGQMN